MEFGLGVEPECAPHSALVPSPIPTGVNFWGGHVPNSRNQLVLQFRRVRVRAVLMWPEGDGMLSCNISTSIPEMGLQRGTGPSPGLVGSWIRRCSRYLCDHMSRNALMECLERCARRHPQLEY